MKVVLINPQNVTQINDVHGTGIPYMPIVLAYLASYLKNKGHTVLVIDSFGEAPFRKRREGAFIVKGLTLADIIGRIPSGTSMICLYAAHVVEHRMVIRILTALREEFPAIPVCMIENSQAVTAYSLGIAYKDFTDCGADYIVLGEPEESVERLLAAMQGHRDRLRGIDGLIYRSEDGSLSRNKGRGRVDDPDGLPLPAWDLFPIENYWGLGYAHAPFRGRYIPLLTSRGCPYTCTFCVMPYMTQRKWRGRRPENVVEEMGHWNRRWGVGDFHIEDANPTVDRDRIKIICRLIIERRLKITFKFASGIKLDTVDEKAVDLLARAGCDYISFSPESGSRRILEKMGKPFDYDRGVSMTRLMAGYGIKSQACFVVGFPGESDGDRRLTWQYVKRLVKAGIDEIALFMMTPLPGAKPYEGFQRKPEDLSRLTFSPQWRREYRRIDVFRTFVYYAFISLKFLYHPVKAMRHPVRLLSRRFDTKMEMTLYRLFKTYFY